MSRKPMMDEEKLCRPLCVRWSDAEHKALIDTAWKMRVHASELVRRLVAEGLAQIAAVTATRAVNDCLIKPTSAEHR